MGLRRRARARRRGLERPARRDPRVEQRCRCAEEVLYRVLSRPVGAERVQRRQRPVHRLRQAGAHGRERPGRPVFELLGLGCLPFADPAESGAVPARDERHDPVARQRRGPMRRDSTLGERQRRGWRDAGRRRFADGVERIRVRRARVRRARRARAHDQDGEYSRHRVCGRDDQRRTRELSADELHHERRMGNRVVDARIHEQRSRASRSRSATPRRRRCCSGARHTGRTC